MGYLLSFVAGIIFTEFVGYWLHTLLHSEKLPILSKAHMLHHLRDYGIGKPLHRTKYFSSADERTNFLGIGMEWFAPIFLIVLVAMALMTWMGIELAHQFVFILSGSLWGYFLFGYMHGSMHLTNFWMSRVPVLKHWYHHIRKLHDYHHLQISDDGRMQKNYGICFFWFDRLLGTYSPQNQPFNHSGYQAALVRYEDILQEKQST